MLTTTDKKAKITKRWYYGTQIHINI